MVEQKLKRRRLFRTKHQLFQSLRRKVMYPTITVILDYLEESNKIAYRKDGSILWIFKDHPNNKRRMSRQTSVTSRKR